MVVGAEIAPMAGPAVAGTSNATDVSVCICGNTHGVTDVVGEYLVQRFELP